MTETSKVPPRKGRSPAKAAIYRSKKLDERLTRISEKYSLRIRLLDARVKSLEDALTVFLKPREKQP